jgi:SAM-dependent methyltransferase
MDKLMEDGFSKLKEDEDLEIEARLIIDPRKRVPGFVRSRYSKDETNGFVSNILKDNTLTNFKITKSVNIIISKGDINYIQMVSFPTNTTKKVSFHTKRTISSMFSKGAINYKFSINAEKDVKMVPSSHTPFIRGKLRASLDYGNWQLDITLTKSTKDRTNAPLIKQRLLIHDLTRENFMTTAPFDYCDEVEIEVEWKSDEEFPDIEDFKQIDNLTKYFPGKGVTKSLDSSLYELAKQLGKRHASSIKQIWNNAVELTKNMYNKLVSPKLKEFMVTDKADGFRAIVRIDPSGTKILTNKNLELVDPESKSKSTYKKEYKYVAEAPCILDTEIVNGTIYAFDIITAYGTPVHLMKFKDRYQVLQGICDELKINCKKFYDLSEEAATKIKNLANKKIKLPYLTDGIIFTAKLDGYSKTKHYKWKQHSTIDFLTMKCPTTMLGIRPYLKKPKHSLYLLFVGIDKGVRQKLNLGHLKHHDTIFKGKKTRNLKYGPIHFSPSMCHYAYLFWHPRDDLNGQICELVRNGNNWDLVHIRDDKKADADAGIAFGNDFMISELIYTNYFNPLTSSALVDTSDNGYFKQHDVSMYRPMRAFNSFVKNKYMSMSGREWVVDLASGKGQDLFRYAELGFKNVLFVEFDKDAIGELISRKFDYTRNREKKGSINIRVVHADLNKPYIETMKLINTHVVFPIRGAESVICNMAMHYFMKDKNAMLNIAMLVNTLLRKGGAFVFTAFNGEHIHRLLSENKQWDYSTGGKLKHSIKRSYTDSKLKTGMKIQVKLPFSGEEYYEEYLLNYEKFSSILVSPKITGAKIHSEVLMPFYDWYPEYTKTQSKVKLDEGDQQMAKLYHLFIYKKL